jgi:hypothetical protein
MWFNSRVVGDETVQTLFISFVPSVSDICVYVWGENSKILLITAILTRWILSFPEIIGWLWLRLWQWLWLWLCLCLSLWSRFSNVVYWCKPWKCAIAWIDLIVSSLYYDLVAVSISGEPFQNVRVSSYISGLHMLMCTLL